MFNFLYKNDLFIKKIPKIHVSCWLIFIIYEILIAATYTGDLKPFFHYFLFYTLNISLFYFHVFILLKKGLTNSLRDLWRIPTFLILEAMVYFILTCLIVYTLNHGHHSTIAMPYLSFKSFAVTLWRGVYFALYGTAYYISISYYEKQRKILTQAIENEKLKNQVLSAEQAFLRAQINPHLLFNTLSFIKYAAKKKPKEADEAVLRLSSIMGFALDNSSEVTLLTKEMDQVENIIQLNQLRFNHALHIDYTKTIQNDQVMIIPIVLLTLVENVFKHGNVTDKDYPAQIHVTSTADEIILHTCNLPNRNSNVHSTKTGLTNIASRLNQAYKENFSFNYGLDENLFKVEIKIYLQNN